MFCLFLFPRTEFAHNVEFELLTPCSCSIALPSQMKVINPNHDASPDWCDFDVILEAGSEVL